MFRYLGRRGLHQRISAAPAAITTRGRIGARLQLSTNDASTRTEHREHRLCNTQEAPRRVTFHLLLIKLFRVLILLVLRLLGLLSLRGSLARLLLLRLLGLLPLLRRLLLRRLKIRIGLAGALGISGCSRIIRGLGTVRGLIPTLLRLLLDALLTALLRRALCAGLVNGNPVVLVQRRLIAALIFRELARHLRR